MFFYFLIKLFAFHCYYLLKSVEKITMFCNNLFLFSLCLVLLSSFFSFPVVFGQSTNEGGKKAETTMRISLCGFRPLLLVKSLFWKSCFCCFSHFSIPAVHLRLQPDRFNPNLLSVCSAALFLLNMNLRCSTVAFAAVFSQEHNRTQIARGNLK